AYVPMDPEYPVERFRHILADTEAKLIITQSHLKNKLSFYGSTIESTQSKMVGLITIDTEEYLLEEKVNLPRYSQSTDLAYVIYTSGTTGLPKGVSVEYKSAINTLNNLKEIYDVRSDDNVSAFTSYVFDVSISEIFISLIQGSQLHILYDEVKSDSNKLSQYILDKQISYLYIPPVLLGQLPQIKYPSLKKIIYAGEPCSKGIAEYWSNKIKLHNIYGPTEATIYCIEKQIINSEVSQIGKPMGNVQTYILDQHMTPVPIGVIGELYIGGAGLARGYLNRPELAEERFVSNPFATERDIAKGYTRLYKTGDLVRWLSDGNIEYIGRNDDQVKIRGYRIELGEIENQLGLIEGVRQSCVLAKDKNDSKYLVGYYVLDKETTLIQEEILNRLAKVLPEYMMPSILVELEGMPLTVNGKLDRRGLPEPDFVNEASYVAPTTELEVTLCNIFAEVLGLEKVGITDDFFRVGGNSILAIKLASRISKVLDINVGVVDIFTHKNIKSLVNIFDFNQINDLVEFEL
ncbi:non-ribosomal peptide synthetase, partial [Francisella sciaenopsi]|uniref:non-ribosomal peptide synthetase n=1 Tax=Francisella sciaenopsi TaxID=3055034 RepID=UPI0038B2FDC2